MWWVHNLNFFNRVRISSKCSTQIKERRGSFRIAVDRAHGRARVPKTERGTEIIRLGLLLRKYGHFLDGHKSRIKEKINLGLKEIVDTED